MTPTSGSLRLRAQDGSAWWLLGPSSSDRPDASGADGGDPWRADGVRSGGVHAHLGGKMGPDRERRALHRCKRASELLLPPGAPGGRRVCVEQCGTPHRANCADRFSSDQPANYAPGWHGIGIRCPWARHAARARLLPSRGHSASRTAPCLPERSSRSLSAPCRTRRCSSNLRGVS